MYKQKESAIARKIKRFKQEVQNMYKQKESAIPRNIKRFKQEHQNMYKKRICNFEEVDNNIRICIAKKNLQLQGR